MWNVTEIYLNNCKTVKTCPHKKNIVIRQIYQKQSLMYLNRLVCEQHATRVDLNIGHICNGIIIFPDKTVKAGLHPTCTRAHKSGVVSYIKNDTNQYVPTPWESIISQALIHDASKWSGVFFWHQEIRKNSF